VIAPGSYRQEIEQHKHIFARLCHVETTQWSDRSEAPANSAVVVVNDATIYLPLAGMVDVAAECQRLAKEQDKLRQQIERSLNLLNNENFTARAKPEVVERERKSLGELQASAAQIADRLAELCG
jgi:valyl-tRNA synthetase